MTHIERWNLRRSVLEERMSYEDLGLVHRPALNTRCVLIETISSCPEMRLEGTDMGVGTVDILR